MKTSSRRFGAVLLLFLLACMVSITTLAVDQQPIAQPLVTNVFDNTYLVDALRDVSAQTGVAIVADSTVNGQITISLNKVPLEDALQLMLAPGGFVYRKMDSYYLVGAPDVKNPSFQLLSRTEIVKLRYTKAEAASAVLAEPFKQYVKVDRDNNSIVITAPDVIIKRLKIDLALIDQQTPQIMIEALIVDITKNGRKELGLDWSWDHNSTADSTISGQRTYQVLDLGTNIGYTSNGGIDVLLLNLKAVVEKGYARIEANPRVATLDGQTAEIFIGRERYYELFTQQNSEVDSQLESIKTGINLKLIPQIGTNGEITIHVEPEVSDVMAESSSSSNLPIINRRKVITTIRVKDGESIVLGGLIQRTNQKVDAKVPVLGDIPLVGLLFKSKKVVQEEGEVLVIITPRILKNSEKAEVSSLKINGEPLATPAPKK